MATEWTNQLVALRDVLFVDRFAGSAHARHCSRSTAQRAAELETIFCLETPRAETGRVGSFFTRGTVPRYTEAERPPEAADDLPQCQMGGKAVDDMRFMISCTNWY
ncbi:hypothetical protein GN956_G5431 [Arapaima gigas]